MAAAKAKPVTLTQVSAGTYGTNAPTPKALLVVGEIPVPVGDVVTLTAVPASFADEAAVRTYLNTLVTQLKTSDYFD